MEYVIKVICIQQEKIGKAISDTETEFYTSEREWICSSIDEAETFDKAWLTDENFEDYVNAYHGDIEREVNKYGLTVDRFELCEVNLKEIAKIVI